MSKRKDTQYDEEQVDHWLAWLAKNMQRHDQTVFLIENLQPSWLSTRSEAWMYTMITRMLWGIWAGLIVAAIFGLIFDLTSWIKYGLIVGLVVGLLDSRKRRKKQSSVVLSGESTIRRYVSSVLRITLLVALIVALGDFQNYGMLNDPVGWLQFVLIQCLIFGLIFGRLYASRYKSRTPSTAIVPVEALSWSRTAAIRSRRRGVIFGLIFGAMFGVVVGVSEDPGNWVMFGLILGIVGGLIGWLIGMLLGGFAPAIRDLKTEPNQGIWLSLRNATRIGGLSGLVMGLVVGFVSAFFGNGMEAALGFGLAYGLLTAVALGMWFGGFEVVEHGILRLIFWRKGYAPLNYAEFLDYAADELNFLQKVGGGYIFIHRYLLEYFASMADEPLTSVEQTLATGDD